MPDSRMPPRCHAPPKNTPPPHSCSHLRAEPPTKFLWLFVLWGRGDSLALHQKQGGPGQLSWGGFGGEAPRHLAGVLSHGPQRSFCKWCLVPRLHLSHPRGRPGAAGVGGPPEQPALDGAVRPPVSRVLLPSAPLCHPPQRPPDHRGRRPVLGRAGVGPCGPETSATSNNLAKFLGRAAQVLSEVFSESITLQRSQHRCVRGAAPMFAAAAGAV